MKYSGKKELKMESRKEIINRLWHEIHGNRVPVFIWDDDTTTAYYYDWVNNLIRSDNGFAVPIDASDTELTRNYLLELITRLEDEIVSHYYDHFNVLLLHD